MKKRSKKAQIAYFIVIGILLFAITSFLIYIQSEKLPTLEQTVAVSNEHMPIKVWLENCIKQAAVDATYSFGYNQGYFDIPQSSLKTPSGAVAYYYDKEKTLVPNNWKLQEELSKTVSNELKKCTDFALFESQGYSFEVESTTTKTAILGSKVLFDISLPIIIEKETKFRVKEFSYELPFRVGHIADVARTLVQAVKIEPNALDLTLLLNQDVDVSVFDYDRCNQIYIMIDNESRLKKEDEPFVFTFAIQKEEEYCNVEAEGSIPDIDLPKKGNSDPKLESIPDQVIQVGETFELQIEAQDPDGDTLFYGAGSVLTNNTHVLTGLIQFIPTEDQKGVYEIDISVIDFKGGLDTKTFNLEIK